MKHLKFFIVFAVFLLLMQQISFAQTGIKTKTAQSSKETLASNVQVFFYVGVHEDSIAHIVWENYNESSIKEVVLESSYDGQNFTKCSRAVLSSLPDIHLIGYPKEINYYNNILKSTETGSIKYIFNDVVKKTNLKQSPKWYRVKMTSFSGYTYISQVVGTKDSGKKIKGQISQHSHEAENANTISEESGYGWLPKMVPGCSSVQTVPSGYTATTTSQLYYGTNCCYWVETLYKGPVLPTYNSCGNYGVWCCNTTPEASSCPSGYAEDPCCVHPCSDWSSCSCHPWDCCGSVQADQWIVTEAGQAGSPANPVPVASPNILCGSGSSTLTATVPGYNIYWYTGACGGTLINTGNTITVSPSTTTTYYARAWSATCGESCGSVVVSVNPVPSAVTVAGGGSQCGGTMTLTASGGTGGTIYWQGTTTNGTSTATPSTSQVVSTYGTYYFRAYNNGCWGPQGSVLAGINAIPPNPSPVAGPSSTCTGGSSTLTASVTGASIFWYTGSCGGTMIGSGTSIVVTPGTTTTYYSRAYVPSTGCWSVGCGTTTVSLGTVSTPVITAAPAAICGSGSTTLSTSVGGAVIYWYAGSCGGQFLGSGMTNVVVSPTSTSTYYARAYSGSCTPSACGNVVVTIGTPTAQTITGTTTLCSGTTTTLTSTSPGGTWTSGNVGVATINSSGVVTGVSAGTSLITYSVTVNGCVNTATKTVTVSSSIPQSITGTSPLCVGSIANWTSTNTGGTWTSSASSIATVGASSGVITAVAAGTSLITYSVNISGCTGTATSTVTVYNNISTAISGGTTPTCYNTSPGTITADAMGGSGTYTYQWYSASSIINGATNSTYTPGNLTSTTDYYCTISSAPCGPVNTQTRTIVVAPEFTVDAIHDTAICTKVSPGIFNVVAHGGTGTYSYLWYRGGVSTGVTSSTYNPGVLQNPENFYCVVTNTCGVITTPTIHVTIVSPVGTPSPVTVSGGSEPTCIITSPTTTNYSTTAPNATSYSWSISNPAAGSIDAQTGVMTWAVGFYGTVDISVAANGCDGPTLPVTRHVTVSNCGTGHIISGKTRYLGRANSGSPIPNAPTYNSVQYDINKEIVILKQLGSEIARDTSNAVGSFIFTNISDGNYTLSYDKLTGDTMQWGNDVNAIDIAIVKYFVGSDTTVDPSRCFSWKYKRGVDVDNNGTVNSIDVARIKAKVGNPNSVAKNFPGGNWPSMDTAVTVSGADINVILKTVCYGDYNASSIKYRDSTTNWSTAKSLPSNNIIDVSSDYLITSDPDYFEVPLRISSKVKDFSALGLELNYPNKDYRLERVTMTRDADKMLPVKINPTLEEILADNNDLLVTEEEGLIRVVYATTNHYDVTANEELIRLGFRTMTPQQDGEVNFNMTGTGVIGDQYGVEQDAYLIMPKVYVQGDKGESGFEFSAYPNPFNNEATITYNIPDNGTVKLQVYNSIGELVSELVNEPQNNGKHAVVFSQKDLPSGMYTFKLEYINASKTKTLVLKLIH